MARRTQPPAVPARVPQHGHPCPSLGVLRLDAALHSSSVEFRSRTNPRSAAASRFVSLVTLAICLALEWSAVSGHRTPGHDSATPHSPLGGVGETNEAASGSSTSPTAWPSLPFVWTCCDCDFSRAGNRATSPWGTSPRADAQRLAERHTAHDTAHSVRAVRAISIGSPTGKL